MGLMECLGHCDLQFFVMSLVPRELWKVLNPVLTWCILQSIIYCLTFTFYVNYILHLIVLRVLLNPNCPNGEAVAQERLINVF